jgi:hypothetical protein
MKRILAVLALLLISAGHALGQYVSVSGYVQQGGMPVVVGGVPPSAAKFMRTFPGATVTVYATGTTNPAPIFSASTGSVKANPFTSYSDTSFWQFFVLPGTYDLRFSGTGISSPWTITVPVSSTGLGNGATVIDPTALTSHSGFSAQVNAAIALGAAVIDARGYACPVDWSATINPFPNGEIILPSCVMNRANGVQFLLASGEHVHGTGTYVTTDIESVNTTNDFSTIFTGPGQVSDVQLDHFKIGETTHGGIGMPVTAVANASAGTTVYTGTFTSTGWSSPLPASCAANACVGYSVGIFGSGTNPLSGLSNEGYFTITASTASTLTVNNPSGSLETTTTGTAVLSGAWGIVDAFTNSDIHDILMYKTDLGIQLSSSGCTCYNSLWNLELLTYHGALFYSPVANYNPAWNIAAWATDQAAVGLANATGYGVRMNNAWFDEIDGLDSENTKYPLIIRSNSDTITNFYWENQSIRGQNANVPSALPVIRYGSYNNKIDSNLDVVDQSGNNSNIYGTSNDRVPVLQPFGSVVVAGIPTPSIPNAAIVIGSGSTEWVYGLVAVDFNGNKTLLYEMDVTGQATSLSPGVAVNSIGASGAVAGVHGFDVIKCFGVHVAGCSGGTWKSLALNVTAINLPWYDDGTGDAGALAYTPPSRNSTGNLIVSGLSTASGFADTTNCSSAGGTCTSATAGAVTIASGGATTVVVTTTAVTASSDISVAFDASMGTRLSVTCNTAFQQPYVSARVPGTSFTISTAAAFTTNPGCISWSLRN